MQKKLRVENTVSHKLCTLVYAIKTHGWQTKCTVGGPLSTTLQYAKVNIVNLQTCASALQKYGMPLYTNQMCTSTVVTAACQGDGGGPVVCNGRSRSGAITNVIAGALNSLTITVLASSLHVRRYSMFCTTYSWSTHHIRDSFHMYCARMLGIMSYSVKCNSGVPEVNTRVSSFSDTVNLYATTFKDAVDSATPANCTDGDVDCIPKVSEVVVLKDSNSTSETTTASVCAQADYK